MDERMRGRGREIEELGYYHPIARPKPVASIDPRRALEWLYRGAQCSDTARSVLSKHGVLKAFAEGVKPEEMVVPEDPKPAAEETVALEAAPVAEPVEAAAEVEFSEGDAPAAAPVAEPLAEAAPEPAGQPEAEGAVEPAAGALGSEDEEKSE